MTQRNDDRRELVAFLAGKIVATVRFTDSTDDDGFDLLFTDGSELELYALDGVLAWVPMTFEDIAANEARDRELLELGKRAASEDGTVTLNELLDQHKRLHGEELE